VAFGALAGVTPAERIYEVLLSFFFSHTYILPLFVPANDIRRSFCPVNVGILRWLGYIRARFWARGPVKPGVEVVIGLAGESSIASKS
jgi:hypothetical protein